MNKFQKIIVYGFISIVVCYFVYFMFKSAKYNYYIDMNNYKPYLWIIKDSVKKDIDTNIFVSFHREKDILTFYNYKHQYYISIWDFKNLNKVALRKISINRNVNLDTVKFNSSETLNAKSNPEYTIRFGPFFKNSINVNIDNLSKIEKTFETSNYKGFYGTINKMSLSDEDGKHQVIIEYNHSKTPFELLFYKGHNGFYLITIDSEKPFDESIIKIFNLK